jgi:hypothetical protein
MVTFYFCSFGNLPNPRLRPTLYDFLNALSVSTGQLTFTMLIESVQETKAALVNTVSSLEPQRWCNTLIFLITEAGNEEVLATLRTLVELAILPDADHDFPRLAKPAIARLFGRLDEGEESYETPDRELVTDASPNYDERLVR